MTKVSRLVPEFVEFAPPQLKEGVLYVSMTYGSAVHKCCCGCGEKVVTPFSPTDWKLTFDGESISLHPSIGNWSFKCRSHYWIRENRVEWAPQWSQKQIDAERARDRRTKVRFFAARRGDAEVAGVETQREREPASGGLWSNIKSWLGELLPKN